MHESWLTVTVIIMPLCSLYINFWKRSEKPVLSRCLVFTNCYGKKKANNLFTQSKDKSQWMEKWECAPLGISRLKVKDLFVTVKHWRGSTLYPAQIIFLTSESAADTELEQQNKCYYCVFTKNSEGAPDFMPVGSILTTFSSTECN